MVVLVGVNNISKFLAQGCKLPFPWWQTGLGWGKEVLPIPELELTVVEKELEFT